MPATISRRRFSNEFGMANNSIQDASSPVLLNFDVATPYSAMEQEPMLFGEMDDVPSAVPFPWTPINDVDNDVKPMFTYGTPPLYEYGPAQSSPDSFYDSGGGFYTPDDPMNSPSYDSSLNFSNWVNDLEPSPSLSSPIPIPSPVSDIPMSQFVPYVEPSHFPQDGTFSPTEFAAMHPLPSSFSPSSSVDDSQFRREPPTAVDSSMASPQENGTALGVPGWASSLWESSSATAPKPSSPQPRRRSPLSQETTVRLRVPARRGSISTNQGFLSSSAPSFGPHSLGGNVSSSRPYTRRAAETASPIASPDDRDATVRRRRKISAPDELQISSKLPDGVPLKSVLKPPKLAPSAWQLYFTDWIQRQQSSNTRKLNVAQAAKEAGQEYASLTPEEKEPYKRKSQLLKEARERDLDSYMRKLSPDDIKRENAFRAAQRKAGRSRKSNIKDPNAPKKPLSAYFMFLQRIRANPQMVQEIFGDETETTKQSVLAAAKWRSMTDEERKPFLAQAEQEKMEYEAARKLYEEGPSSFNSSFNFSILPRSPSFLSLKMESESESEGPSMDAHEKKSRH